MHRAPGSFVVFLVEDLEGAVADALGTAQATGEFARLSLDAVLLVEPFELLTDTRIGVHLALDTSQEFLAVEECA